MISIRKLYTEIAMKKLVSLLLAAALLLTACNMENATRSETNASCNSSMRKGTCTITLVYLENGPYRFDVHNDWWWPGASSVEVNLRATVETGSAVVWMLTPENEKVSVTVTPGETGELQLPAWVTGPSEEREFSVYFEPLGEGEAKRVENLTAVVDYDLP